MTESFNFKRLHESVDRIEANGIKRTQKSFLWWLRSNSITSTNKSENSPIGVIFYCFTSANTVHFCDDWLNVYNCLIVNDTEDDFSVKAVAFKGALEYLFSRPIIISGLLVTIYFIVLYIIDATASINPILVNYFTISHILLQCFACWGCYNYRGSFLPQRFQTRYFQNESEKGNKSHGFCHRFSIFCDFLKLLFCHRQMDSSDDDEMRPSIAVGEGCIEMANPLHSHNVPDKEPLRSPLQPEAGMASYLKSLDEPEKVDFYEILNVGIKYMKYEGSHSLKGRNSVFHFQRFTFTALRISIVFSVLLSVFLTMLAGVLFIQTPYFILTGFGILIASQYFILIASLMVVFNGLLLCGDLASSMCESWLHRFSGLRKIAALVDSSGREGEKECEDEESEEGGGAGRTSNKSRDGGNGDRSGDDEIVSLPSSTSTSTSASASATMSVPSHARIIRALERSDSQEESVVAVTTRKISEEDNALPRGGTGVGDNGGPELTTLYKLAPHIRRDAFERYLFIQNFMKQISIKWQAFILALLLSSGGGLVGLYVYIYTQILQGNFGPENIGLTLIYVLLVAFPLVFIFVYPLYCLALANAKVKRIQTLFTGSSPGDFGPLGDLDEWSDFIESNPIHWTIYSLPITHTVLQSYVTVLSGLLPTIFAFALSMQSGSGL